jgi:RNA polymerase sigma-70 factor (ECF subfamily)
MRLRKRSSRDEVAIQDLEPKFRDGLRSEEPVAIPDPNASPEQRAMMREDVSGAMSRIPSDFRALLILADVEGFDAKEISVQLGLGHAAVRQRLHRAKKGKKYQSMLYERFSMRSSDAGRVPW